MMTKAIIIGLTAAVLIAGCATDEVIPERFEPDASYREYLRAMTELGMKDSRIGAAWAAAGEPESASPVRAATPFEERRFLDPREPQALFYLVEGVRGHRLDVHIDGPADAGYFVDVFRLPEEYRPAAAGGAQDEPHPWAEGLHEEAASAGGVQHGSSHVYFEPRRHRYYLVRIQPRVLEGGEFTIQIIADAALAWPVPGTDHTAIWSPFGAPRDGGVRVHHGVDIFAPRHTPLVSISEESYVRQVGQRDRGGNVVSMIDRKRDLLLYYAHLEDQEVELQGQTIPAGTEIGTMGNTGNAITTPPHLHIGIYEGSWGRPVDPWYFLVALDTEPEAPAAAPVELGEYVRVAAAGSRLYAYPGQSSSIIPSPAVTDGRGDGLPPAAFPQREIAYGEVRRDGLSPDTVLQLVGIMHSYAKVLAPDGIRGYLPLSAVASLEGDNAGFTLDDNTTLFERIGGSVVPVAVAAQGSRLRDLGSYENYRLVQTEDGVTGWLH
ncbi:M23 family metallopeptidase [Spirochaeta africana]|uniref:Metalloendopeptidase-like membrane protein n=1 Tax=Spirochaeta africana (strain ATCC 700263 / DSM 8902 / Z-7692) TaxID=889378 RepID=H9UIJ8_SPIAZ|nr:M23 family metallopeptidase [Spirochaeta africana]AFG37341.1 metalloendopeptidase-like membrane protein [Spirochaeta africana DSM 8902]